MWFSLVAMVLAVHYVNANGDLTTAQAEFALKLLRESGSATSFAILSPFSISVALAMTYAGAGGETKTEIGNALGKGATDEEILNYFASQITELSRPAKGYELHTANKLFLQESFQVLQTFQDVIKNKFGGELGRINFAEAADAAKEINDWVEEQTRSKIKGLVNAQMIRNAQLALVNAIYFKGEWATKFPADLTTRKMFHVAKDSDREVDMMRLNARLPYTEDMRVQVLGLPYDYHEVFMYVFLPKHQFGLVDFERAVTGTKIMELIHECNGASRVDVELPKFKLDSKFELRSVLQKLGIREAFSSNANFTGISEEPLEISNVVHQATIETNEKGSEAAAASMVIMFRSSRPAALAPPIQFHADHPFMFVIAKGTNILFIGRFH